MRYLKFLQYGQYLFNIDILILDLINLLDNTELPLMFLLEILLELVYPLPEGINFGKSDDQDGQIFVNTAVGIKIGDESCFQFVEIGLQITVCLFQLVEVGVVKVLGVWGYGFFGGVAAGMDVCMLVLGYFALQNAV